MIFDSTRAQLKLHPVPPGPFYGSRGGPFPNQEVADSALLKIGLAPLERPIPRQLEEERFAQAFARRSSCSHFKLRLEGTFYPSRVSHAMLLLPT